MKKYGIAALCAGLMLLNGCLSGPSGGKQNGAEAEVEAEAKAERREGPSGAGMEVVTPVQKQLPLNIEARGRITYDPRRSSTVSLRFGGRIERLYVHYLFEPVRKGQKILEIYSPEAATAQKELLYLLDSDPGSGLAEASRQKLRLLGLSQMQISRLEESGEVAYSLPVYSPYSGYIYQGRPASAGAETEGEAAVAGTAASTMNASGQTRLNIREGMYLEKGQVAFKVINTDRVWAEFSIYPPNAPYVKKGSRLTISADDANGAETSADPGNGPEVSAEVAIVQPFFRQGENFSKVRVYLDNPGNRFMPGQLVTARFQSRSEKAWWIPAAAVLDLGVKNIVFVKKNRESRPGEARDQEFQPQVFRPREIGTGRVSGDWIEVVSGLSASDSIAADGRYLADSEGFIKTVYDE